MILSKNSDQKWRGAGDEDSHIRQGLKLAHYVHSLHCKSSFRSPSERFLRVSSYDDHGTCGYDLMYFCCFVISNFIVNKNLILNKLIIFISAGRSTHSGEI